MGGGGGGGGNEGEWTGKVEIRMDLLAVSVACVAVYWLTPDCKGRPFELCVLGVTVGFAPD